MQADKEAAFLEERGTAAWVHKGHVHTRSGTKVAEQGGVQADQPGKAEGLRQVCASTIKPQVAP